MLVKSEGYLECRVYKEDNEYNIASDKPQYRLPQ